MAPAPPLAEPDFQTRPVEPPYRRKEYGWPFTDKPREPTPVERGLPTWTGHLGHSRACDDHPSWLDQDQNLG
jgi:hypothetical protein